MARTGVVPSAWFGITNCWSAHSLLALLEEVDRRGVEHHDTDAVKRIWREMNARAIEEAEAVQRRIAERAEAARLDQRLRYGLGLTFPALRNKLRVKL